MTKITIQTIRCVREIPGEYLRAGAVYHVTRRESGRGLSATAYFRNMLTQAGTSVKEWQVERALANGSLRIVTREDGPIFLGKTGPDGLAVYANVEIG